MIFVVLYIIFCLAWGGVNGVWALEKKQSPKDYLLTIGLNILIAPISFLVWVFYKLNK